MQLNISEEQIFFQHPGVHSIRLRVKIDHIALPTKYNYQATGVG